MTTALTPIRLLDSDLHMIATGHVEEKNGVYVGSVNLDEMPVSLRELLEEYESLVDSQALSVLDAMEDRIAALKIAALFSDGRLISLNDLQIFPRKQAISFVLGSAYGSMGGSKNLSAVSPISVPGRVA